MNASLTLLLLPERFAVCRFDPHAPLPAWVLHASVTFYSITRTPEELSVVCPEDDLPPSVAQAERGFRAFKLRGPIPFTTTGIISGLTAPLAAAGLSVFVISTYDTDYLLVKEPTLDTVTRTLRAAGHVLG